MKTAKQLYVELYDKVDKVITSYRRDLEKHDREAIRKMMASDTAADESILHYSRSTGSHVIALVHPSYYPADGEYIKYLFGSANREQLLRANMEIHVASLRNCEKIHLISPISGVEELTAEQARSVIKIHESVVRRAWADERRQRVAS